MFFFSKHSTVLPAIYPGCGYPKTPETHPTPFATARFYHRDISFPPRVFFTQNFPGMLPFPKSECSITAAGVWNKIKLLLGETRTINGCHVLCNTQGFNCIPPLGKGGELVCDNRLFISHLSAISLRRCLSWQFSDQEQGCKEKCFVTVHFLTAVNPFLLIDYWPHGLLPRRGLSLALITKGRGDLVYFWLDLQRRVKLGGEEECGDVLLLGVFTQLLHLWLIQAASRAALAKATCNHGRKDH